MKKGEMRGLINCRTDVSHRVIIESGMPHKSIAAAASSGVPPLPSGIVAKRESGSGALEGWGIPRATFFPSISMDSPASFAAVNLKKTQ
jgi:hypothetical protein